MKYFKYIILLTLVFPVAVFAFVKPAKIVFPTLAGIECVKEWLCVENGSNFEQAELLYEVAFQDIEKKLTEFEKRPKVIFCSSQECFSAFGFHKQAGVSIGSFGVVIAPRGWTPYYLKHELIHQWQSEKFGALSVWRSPGWIIEGMAYYLSDDPREELSSPFQSYREKYGQVYGELSGVDLKLALDNEI